MAENWFCWQCGHPMQNTRPPLERIAVCHACNADLHVCRQCRFFNPRMNDRCDEPMADPVRDETRANFCDYFKISHSAFQGGERKSNDQALAELQALFGMAQKDQEKSANQQVPEPLPDLFAKPGSGKSDSGDS